MKINNLLEKTNVEGIKELVANIYNETDKVYFFNPESVDQIKTNTLYKKETFNHFSIYNKSIYISLQKIKKMFIEICKSNEINIEKNMFYISSEYIESFDPLFWYDSGGDQPLCFSGYIILDCEPNSSVHINEDRIDLEVGNILLLKSSSKMIWSNTVTAIHFNISPISVLAGQYKQKWIPMI